jgi:hypothetical protein
MAGLWDLPTVAPRGCRGVSVGAFRHSVLRTRYRVDVVRARCGRGVGGRKGETTWAVREELGSYALTGMARKALAIGLPESAE